METMEKNSFTRNPPDKEREINKRGKKYKQILSKNEFRTKAEKEKGKEMEKRTKRTELPITKHRDMNKGRQKDKGKRAALIRQAIKQV